MAVAGELRAVSAAPWQVWGRACLRWCLALAQTCPPGRSEAERRCRMAPAAESPARRGHGVGGERQARPCLERGADGSEPCRLQWDKFILSWRGARGTGALWSIGKQHASALGKRRLQLPSLLAAKDKPSSLQGNPTSLPSCSSQGSSRAALRGPARPGTGLGACLSFSSSTMLLVPLRSVSSAVLAAGWSTAQRGRAAPWLGSNSTSSTPGHFSPHKSCRSLARGARCFCGR